jgi:uncharacterized protein YjlB
MKAASYDSAQVIAHLLAPAGAIPNHPRWPLLLYPGAVALEGADPATVFEALFDRNRWPAAWRNGVHRASGTDPIKKKVKTSK